MIDWTLSEGAAVMVLLLCVPAVGAAIGYGIRAAALWIAELVAAIWSYYKWKRNEKKRRRYY